MRFDRVIDSVAALRDVIKPPGEIPLKKQLPALDEHARSFIARSPFVVVGTAGDVSPRGEAPGGFVVLDDRTIAIGDRPGNRRLDSFQNLFQDPRIGLLFMVPGVDETLRVNGRAKIVVDAKLFERMAVGGKPPLVALVIEIEEVYFHCAKAFRRSHLWDPKTWPDPQLQPSLAKVIKDQIPSCETSLENLDAMIQEGYTKGLY